VLAGYVILLTFIVSPFLEWRWLLVPLSFAACRGALQFDRVQMVRPRLALSLAVLQLVFLAASLAFWTSRVLAVRV
jgi:hypothetical protein